LRRTFTFSLLALLVMVTVATVPSGGAALGVAKTGIGAYGFVHVPILQDDAATGSLYGVRGRFGLLPLLQAEVSIMTLSGGESSIRVGEQTVRLDSPEMTSFTLNVVFKMGGSIALSTYATGGVGWTLLSVPDGRGATREPTINVGAGMEVGLGPVSADVSPRLFIVNTAGGASRKTIALLAGVNYFFN